MTKPNRQKSRRRKGFWAQTSQARNRKSLATFHRTLKSQCSIAFSSLGNRAILGPRWASQSQIAKSLRFRCAKQNPKIGKRGCRSQKSHPGKGRSESPCSALYRNGDFLSQSALFWVGGKWGSFDSRTLFSRFWGFCYFACSPEKFRDFGFFFFFVFAREFRIEKWRGFLVNNFWSPSPTKRSTKILEKFGENSEQTSGRNSGQNLKISGNFRSATFLT